MSGRITRHKLTCPENYWIEEAFDGRPCVTDDKYLPAWIRPLKRHILASRGAASDRLDTFERTAPGLVSGGVCGLLLKLLFASIIILVYQLSRSGLRFGSAAMVLCLWESESNQDN